MCRKRQFSELALTICRMRACIGSRWYRRPEYVPEESEIPDEEKPCSAKWMSVRELTSEEQLLLEGKEARKRGREKSSSWRMVKISSTTLEPSFRLIAANDMARDWRRSLDLVEKEGESGSSSKGGVVGRRGEDGGEGVGCCWRSCV